MLRNCLLIGYLIFSLCLCANGQSQSQSPANNFTDVLKAELLKSHSDTSINGGLLLKEPKLLEKFYLERTYKAAWVLGRYIPAYTKEFVNCIGNANFNGLDANEYHLEAIFGIINEIENKTGQVVGNNILIELELKLTDAFLHLSRHYFNGKVDPLKLDIKWNFPPRKIDFVGYLNEALEQKKICESLERLLPIHKEYENLKEALSKYQQLILDPIERSDKYVLMRGDWDPVIPEVRNHLFVLGDLKSLEPINEFDRALEIALVRFQIRNGLTEDGMLQGRTWVQLNRAVEERITAIKVAMERWRWMPDDLGGDYFFVNIPAFQLDRVENGTPVFLERVIVGQRNFPTPCFYDSMRYVMVNPYWNIPKSIASNEVIPQVKSDTSYLINHDIKIFKDGVLVEQEELDVESLNGEDFRFRHGVNAFNPMGKVKFMFPNTHDVYIHDTPGRDLFYNSTRSYSHGCVRVNDPMRLLNNVITGNAIWSQAWLDSILFSQQQTKIELITPLPLFITYFTVYVDQNNWVHFREDIYGWDSQIAALLENKKNSVSLGQ